MWDLSCFMQQVEKLVYVIDVHSPLEKKKNKKQRLRDCNTRYLTRT